MMRIAVLILLLGSQLFACEFGALVSYLGRDKGKLDNATLEDIVSSEQPFNPLEHDESMGGMQRHPFLRAFANHLRDGVPPQHWAEVRKEARAILIERTGHAGERKDARAETSWLAVPRLVEGAVVGKLGLDQHPQFEFGRGPAGTQIVANWYAGFPGTVSFLSMHESSGKIEWLVKNVTPPKPSLVPESLRVFGRPGDRTLAVVHYRNNFNTGRANDGVTIRDAQTGAILFHFEDIPQERFQVSSAVIDSAGKITVVLTGQMRDLWTIDSETQKAVKLPYSRKAYQTGTNTEANKTVAGAVSTEGVPLLGRGNYLSVTDLQTGKEFFKARLGWALQQPFVYHSGRGSPPAMRLRPREDGSVLAAVEYRGKIIVLDSSTGKRFEIKHPNMGSSSMGEFVESKKGWIWISPYINGAITQIDFATGRSTTTTPRYGNYSNYEFVTAKDGSSILISDFHDASGSMRIAVISGADTTLFDRPGKSEARYLHSYTTEDGRVFRAYKSGFDFNVVQVYGPKAD